MGKMKGRRHVAGTHVSARRGGGPRHPAGTPLLAERIRKTGLMTNAGIRETGLMTDAGIRKTGLIVTPISGRRDW